MYVKKALIEKEIEWVRGLKPSHPRATIQLGFGKIAAMVALSIIDYDLYDELYDHVRDCMDNSSKTRRKEVYDRG